MKFLEMIEENDKEAESYRRFLEPISDLYVTPFWDNPLGGSKDKCFIGHRAVCHSYEEVRAAIRELPGSTQSIIKVDPKNKLWDKV